MLIPFLTFILLIIATISRNQIWIKYPILQEELYLFTKYFNRIREGYYIDIGGYNPIQLSNTVKLSSNWHGIILQANQARASYLKDFHQHTTVLNFAISNVTGETVTFYEVPAYDVASTISKGVGNLHQNIQQKVTVINMADLCHKYYKSKPNLLNIDAQGVGQSALRSNDWQNPKCIPQVIYAQDFQVNIQAGQVNLQPFLLSKNYSKINIGQSINKLFIHNSKLDFYNKQQQANRGYFNNKQIIQWDNVFSNTITRLLNKPFEPNYKPGTSPAFIYLRQPQVINLMQINRYSNMISTIGSNRPIIILEYDKQKSYLFIGVNNYTITEQTVDKLNFKKITIQYQKQLLIVYIFDHQLYNQFQIKIFNIKSNAATPNQSLNTILKQNVILNQQIIKLQKQIQHLTNTIHNQTLKSDQLTKLIKNQLISSQQTQSNEVGNTVSIDYQSNSRLFVLLLLTIVVLVILLMIYIRIKLKPIVQKIENKNVVDQQCISQNRVSSNVSA